MDISMTLSQLFKYAYPFADFLYLLQLEEYDTSRYFRLLPRFYERRNIQKRDSLVMTNRIRTTLLLSAPLSLIFPPLLPIFVGLANALLQPFFQIPHWIIRQKASTYFKSNGNNTQVIAIAGSFGKTTTRQYIYELLRYHYRVQTTPGNVNTPTGIASWILDSFKRSTEILIIEVDPYFKGEIAQSLRILPPDVSVLTNVGDQHLERFKSQSELSEALHEVFDFAKKGALHIHGTDDNKVAAMAVARHFKIPEGYHC
jgi:UDP-N-acetylmuramoyl-tripeptide--D-alanyl-D-alanine ligase